MIDDGVSVVDGISVFMGSKRRDRNSVDIDFPLPRTSMSWTTTKSNSP
jgi:hypothetical protein